MLIVIHGVKLHAHTYTWIEAFCSFFLHELMLYAHCYTWCTALRSLLCME